jgi:iron(III) transport system substrate-binding protein
MKLLLIFTLIFIFLAQSYSKEQLNLYSARQEVLMRPLIKLFEEETNIKVNIVSAKANQLINRIVQEGDFTNADILLTTDVGRLHIAKEKNIFQKVDNTTLNNLVPSNYRDKGNYWFGVSLRVRLLVYNKSIINKADLNGYIDLANDKWKNKILIRSSSNVYNQSLISAMIINYGEDEVKKFLKGFTGNFARKPSGGDRDQIKAVAAGEGDLALVNSYYFLKMKSEDNEKKLDNVIAYFPKDNFMKTHINISGAGIIKNSKNKENAIKFLEFLVRNEAQKIYAEVNFEYPIRKNIELNKFMKKYNNFIKDDLNLSDLAKLNKKSIMLMDIAGWQ